MDYTKTYGLGGATKMAGAYKPPRESRKGAMDYVRLTEIPQTLRIINGNYAQEVYDPDKGKMVTLTLPYYQAWRHYDRDKNTYATCSAGNDVDLRPCVGCAKGIRKTLYNVFSVIILEHFHKVPWSKDNKPVIRDGKPIMIDQLCEGRNCPACNSQAEKFFGKKAHMVLNEDALNQLVAAEDIQRANCLCGKELQIEKYICSVCGEVLIDIQRTTMSDSAISAAARSGMWCPKCRRPIGLVEETSCSCGNPRPVTLFDANIKVRKAPSNKPNTYNLGVEFSKPGPMPPEYKGDVTPVDMVELFKPLSIPQQRDVYGYRGPIPGMDKESESYEKETPKENA